MRAVWCFTGCHPTGVESVHCWLLPLKVNTRAHWVLLRNDKFKSGFQRKTIINIFKILFFCKKFLFAFYKDQKITPTTAMQVGLTDRGNSSELQGNSRGKNVFYSFYTLMFFSWNTSCTKHMYHLKLKTQNKTNEGLTVRGWPLLCLLSWEKKKAK